MSYTASVQKLIQKYNFSMPGCSFVEGERVVEGWWERSYWYFCEGKEEIGFIKVKAVIIVTICAEEGVENQF